MIKFMNQRGKDLLYSLSLSALSSFCMKLTMEISIIGDILLRIESDFTIPMLVDLKSDIRLKLNGGFDSFIRGSNLYSLRIMGSLDVKGYTAGIMKSRVNMDNLPSMIINISER